ncbi:MAG TPA: hypothetical protein VOA87_10320 [Thermoanaerobaculia bacterium]|nr:hypothetical protein [Thermoanaerobaculia bacterium]
MRKMLMTAILAGATMFAPGLTAPAHAYGWFSIGTGFRVGGLSLSFVLGQPFAAYAPAYYYRAYQPIAYGGYHCTSRCFVDHGVYYHDRACPVVSAYFRNYGYDPEAAFIRYAPQYDGYYNGGGYYGGGYYGGSYYRRSYDRRSFDGSFGRGFDNRFNGRGGDRRFEDRGFHDRRFDDRGSVGRGFDNRFNGRFNGRGSDRRFDDRGFHDRRFDGRDGGRRSDGRGDSHRSSDGRHDQHDHHGNHDGHHGG